MSGACWVELDAHDVNAREFIFRASPDEFRFEEEPWIPRRNDEEAASSIARISPPQRAHTSLSALH